MDIELLISAEQGKLDAALAQRSAAVSAQEAILAAVKADNERKALTADEDASFATHSAEKRAADALIATHEAKLTELRAEAKSDADFAKRAAEVKPGAEKRAYDQVARVAGVGELVYREDARGDNFFKDVIARDMGHDGAAAERLARHMSQQRELRPNLELRASATSNFGAVVPPQFLTDLFLGAASSGRPTANRVRSVPLPEYGTTIDLGALTTVTAVSSASENATITETSPASTTDPVTINYFAGQATLSVMSAERGVGIVDIVLADMAKRYGAAIDAYVVAQLIAAASNVDYADGSPTAAALRSKILKARSASETALLDLGNPDTLLLTPSRFAWLEAATSAGFPLVTPAGWNPLSTGQNNGNSYGSGLVRGSFAGLDVITDTNVPTTGTADSGTGEDSALVFDSQHSLLFESDDVVYIQAKEAKAAQGGILLVAYGYAGFSASRVTGAVQQVTGSGMEAPSF